jgi:hypothetical protein
MRHIYWRYQWDARPPRGVAKQGPPLEAFLHHSDDPKPEQFDHIAEQMAHMRQLQNFHMDTRGWSDIAYHWIVFQKYGNVPGPRAFCGRHWNWVPAAQLNHNTRTLAICVVGNNPVLQADTEKLIVALLGRYKKLKTLGGHRDVTATTCPGNNIYKRIPNIAKAAKLKVY